MKRKLPKKLVLDSKHLDPESTRCQNRNCGAARSLIVDIDSDQGKFSVPMCKHCAGLAVRPAAQKQRPIRNADA